MRVRHVRRTQLAILAAAVLLVPPALYYSAVEIHPAMALLVFPTAPLVQWFALRRVRHLCGAPLLEDGEPASAAWRRWGGYGPCPRCGESR